VHSPFPANTFPSRVRMVRNWPWWPPIFPAPRGPGVPFPPSRG
jgi:hypothetical protein